MAVQFCSIASGSSGNSLYVGTECANIIIDAGLSGIKIRRGLETLGVHPENIDAIFITHEHSDHIKGAGILSRRFDIPLYATWGTWECMQNDIGAVAEKNRKVVYAGERIAINDLCVKPYAIPHDACEPVGYNIFADRYKISVATDIGHATDGVKEAVSDSDILFLEANHDIEMLKCGSYPYPLKKRILSDNGHLSNPAAGHIICDIMSGRLQKIILGHLSNENNLPALAYHTVEQVLQKRNIPLGKFLKMEVAPRYSVGRMVKLA